MKRTIEELKSTVLPRLFEDPTLIGRYGDREADGGKDAMTELGDLMEQSPVARLSGCIRELVAKLADANPQRIARKPSWLQRMMGKDVEAHVMYQLARRQIDQILEDAAGAEQSVRDAITAIDRLLSKHQDDVTEIDVFLAAGRQYLDENPDAGKPDASSLAFDVPRERFARKLVNLATLKASHELSVTQMRLTKAQAVDLLDRFEQTATVLVPVWRQHTLQLTTTQSMNPTMLAEATRAHEALMRSLAQSADGLSA